MPEHKDNVTLKRLKDVAILGKGLISPLLTEIELAKTEEELEVIDFENRRRKEQLLGQTYILSDIDFQKLQASRRSIRTEILDKDTKKIAEILKTIASLKEKEKDLETKFYRDQGINVVKSKTIKLEMDILHALNEKIQYHKERLHFKKTRNALLNNMALGIDSLSSAADVLKFIPGLNLIFEVLSKTLEITALMLESYAYNEDEYVEPHLKEALQEHITAIRQFMRAELASSIAATALLGVSLAFPPALIAGVGMTLIANIIAIPRLNRAIEKEELRKDIPGHKNRLKALQAERDGKIYTVLGIIALLAATTLAVVFPPFGAALIAGIVLTAVASAFAGAVIKKEMERRNFEHLAKSEMDKAEILPHPKLTLSPVITETEHETSALKEKNPSPPQFASELAHLKSDFQHLHEEKAADASQSLSNDKLVTPAFQEKMDDLEASEKSKEDASEHPHPR